MECQPNLSLTNSSTDWLCVCVCVCVEHLSQLCSYEIYAVLVAWKQAYHGKQDFYCSFKIIQTVFKQIGWSYDSMYLNESVVTNLI